MTATSLPVKMAACLPQDGDTTDEEKITRCTTSHTLKHPIGGTQGEDIALSATSIDILFEGDKAYDEVAKYDEEDLRNLLEEVTNVGRNKASISPYALLLIRKEQDALREESSSDDGELALRQRNKKLIGRRDQSTTSDQSAAARASTGGSLGSLHDSGEPKPKEGHNQGVASRSREGGSCGNLSRGSFETQPPRKRKWRRSRDAARASTSQREGGSLQNLSKTEGPSNHPKNLHKSGSLSQVCSEVTGARNKNRRQKTSSESSSSRYPRRSEDREGGGESSGDENPYHCLLPSPHSTLSTHSAEHSFPPEGVGGASGLGNDWNNDLDDSQSEDATDEETDEENENVNKEYSRGLGLGGLGRNCSNEPIEEDGIELQEVTVHKSSTDVDRGINFNLTRSQEDNMHGSCGRRTQPLQDSQCVNSIFKEEKSKGSDHDEVLGKRKLLTSRSDSANSENKSSLDENGNPIMGTSSSSSLLTSANSERPFGSTHPVPRRNGLSAPHKEISRFDRLKAKSDKKKANKEKGVVNIKETPGFCGDQDLHDILKFLGAETETSTKSRKKHNEKVKKRSKNNEKIEDEKLKTDDISSKVNDDVTISVSESNRKSREREEERKTTNNKKNKSDSGKSKKKGGNLRESSSVEDLVSKSKQSDNVRDIRKQVTVDDGDMGLGVLHTYHTSKKVDQLNNFIVDGKYLKESDLADVQNDNESSSNPTSEFVADFYSAGDSFLTADLTQTPSSPSGDFEIVSSRKRNKKYRSGSQTASQSSKSGGSDRWSAGSNSGSVYSDDNFRGSKFCPIKVSARSNAGYEKPQINFMEGPRTVHENTFLARWSQYGVGERHGGDRYGATTSAPHSEDSDSDGDDSVHSMPVPSITPRPDVRKPPPSSGSTPQASYANIAKLAASANHAHMKRMSAASGSQSATGGLMKELEKDNNNDTEQPDLKPNVSESRPNILDDNFPSLTESLGASSPPSAIFTSKVSETRTNPACESAVIPPKVSNVQLQTLDKPKDMSGVCDGKSGTQENVELVPASITSQESSAKSPVACPLSTSSPPPPHHSCHQYPQHQVRYPSYQPHQPSPPPPQHSQSFQPRTHYQNHKHSQHPNTQYNSSHNAPPLYYQYQRYNPFNRKDDDSPPNRFPTPLRAPNSNHLNVVPPYPPPMQPTPPHFKQPQFSQPPPHVQQNPHPQQNLQLQRNPQSAQTTQLQNQNFHDKPPPQQHNLSAQQYPPLQSPYSQNSQVPKSHMQSSTHIQRNPQPHSQSNLNPQHSPNLLQSPPPIKNTIPQQNHHSQSNVQFNSHSQPSQQVEQLYMHKVHNPVENTPQSVPSSQRQVPNSEQSISSPHQNHKLLSQVEDSPSEQTRPDQRCSPPLLNSTPQCSVLESTSVLHPPPVAEASKEELTVHHTNSLPIRESTEDRHLVDNKSHKSSDTSRLKKLEPAVVFTDNAKFDHSVSGLEFGFGFDDPIVTSDSVSESDNISNDVKNTNNVTKDFSKWFQAPKNDVISYNYEELTRHLSNEWDRTVQLMEGDPKNVQYWRASSSMEA